MGQSFFDRWRHRVHAAWDVLVGRAWAGYGDPRMWVYVGDEDRAVGSAASDLS